MATVHEICQFLDQHAPAPLAEDWDNVGLLVGDPLRTASRIMTCLTVTPATAVEAVREKADLILTHHPLPFRPLKQLTTQSVTGRMLLELVEARVAVYSSHTAFDSAASGINQMLAEGLELGHLQPLIESPQLAPLGAGRFGTLTPPVTLPALVERLKRFLGLERLQVVGEPDRSIRQVAVACGSAGQFLLPAHQAGCDALVTGETSFHTCLEAEALGVALLLPGHYASERFGMERLAERVAGEFPAAVVWASRNEKDPLRWT